MKMSDKFQLPVNCFVSTVKLNIGCSMSFLNVESASGKDHNKHSDCEFIEHAINNHDRLTEESAKLREFVRVVSSAKVYTVEVSNPYGGTDDMDCLCDSLKDKAQQLLNQLKDQNNDK